MENKEHNLQDKRCECCGYMTYHSEHIGCIRAAEQAQQAEPEAWKPGSRQPSVFKTSEAGRQYVADFFANALRRHDFSSYIKGHLAADFACALSDGLHAMQQGQPPAVADRDAIRRVFMAHVFTIKEGQTDLKPYVYEAAEALLLELSPAVAVPGFRDLTDDELCEIRNHVAINEVTRDDDSKTICVKHGRAIVRAMLAAAQKGGV